MNEDLLIKEIFAATRVIAVVGISDRPDRPSFGVAEYLARYYEIIPVNPTLKVWQGRECYPSLLEIPASITVDMVDVFRRSDAVMPIAQEAVSRKVKCLWLQLGVVNIEAKAAAEAAGISIIMDRCTAVEHARYRPRKSP